MRKLKYIGYTSAGIAMAYMYRKLASKKADTNYISEYLKAIKEEDMARFLSYQNRDNKYFYKEQERWLTEIQHKRKKGFVYEPEVLSFKKIDKHSGCLAFSLKITRPSGREKSVQGVYSLIKNEKNKWLLNDFTFEEIQGIKCTIKFLGGDDEEAFYAVEFVDEVLKIYMELFDWSIENITIKLFSDLDPISLSIPTFAIYGWSEEKESLKVLVPEYAEDRGEFLRNLLTHEISHKMLSALTKDNASLYIQEGLAVFLEKSITIENDKVIFSSNNLDAYLSDVIHAIDTMYISIDQLNQLGYNDGEKLYYHGFLLVNFLIETFGIVTFLKFLELLKNYEYEDSRIIYKLSLINERTLKSLTEVYGDVKVIQNQMKQFYASKDISINS